jgi:ribonuclease T1
MILDFLKPKDQFRSTLLRIFLGLCLFLVMPVIAGQVFAFGPSDTIPAAELSGEAHETFALIRSGGPFPYAQDGAIFANRERLLPPGPRGSYREYTVRTPGRRDRGARRIVARENGEIYYTDDHYRSFRRILQ